MFFSKQFKSQCDRSLWGILNEDTTVTSQLLCVCFRYDPSTDMWQYICHLPSPRQTNAAGLMRNKIHIIGNYSEGKGHPTTEIYDTQNDNFTKVGQILQYFRGALFSFSKYQNSFALIIKVSTLTGLNCCFS